MKNVLRLGVFIFLIGSMASCKGDKVAKAEVGEKTEKTVAKGASYAVDATLSKVMWEGSKPAGAHNGTVNVTEGKVVVDGDKLSGGSFVLDMNTISVLDLEGDQKAYLESHLKGLADDNADDFFNVNKYPTGKYEITKVTGLANDPEATHLIYGNLTLRDVTKSVSFKAKVDMSDAGVRVTTPKFKIDRTEWGIKYGSDKFFKGLKDKVISDNFVLQVNLIAKA